MSPDEKGLMALQTNLNFSVGSRKLLEVFQQAGDTIRKFTKEADFKLHWPTREEWTGREIDLVVEDRSSAGCRGGDRKPLAEESVRILVNILEIVGGVMSSAVSFRYVNSSVLYRKHHLHYCWCFRKQWCIHKYFNTPFRSHSNFTESSIYSNYHIMINHFIVSCTKLLLLI